MKKCQSEGFSHSLKLPNLHIQKRWKVKKEQSIVVYHLSSVINNICHISMKNKVQTVQEKCKPKRAGRAFGNTTVFIQEAILLKNKLSNELKIDPRQCKIYEKSSIMNVLFSQTPDIPLHSQAHLHLSDSLANHLPPIL